MWVACCIKLLRELLSQGAGDQSPQHIAHNKPARASRGLAKSNKSSQGDCSGDRCRHRSSGEEGRDICKHKCRLFIIENEAKHFGSVSAWPRCGALACAAEVGEQSGSI